MILQFTKLSKNLGIFLASFLLVPMMGFSESGPLRSANQIDYTNYFLADIRDAEECRMQYRNGEFIFPKNVTNPAVTCPDMFSWKLYIEVIQNRFWSAWADESQNWPAEPYQLCSQGGVPGLSCCSPGASNNPQGHCPVFPGDSHKSKLKRLNKMKTPAMADLKKDTDLLRIGIPSIIEHANDISIDPDTTLKIRSDNTLPECPASVIDGLVPKEYESIGRVIRQTNSEVTVRNRTFHYYLFDNNLYNATGVMDVFELNAHNVNLSNAPYHLPNRSAKGADGNFKLARIDLPSDSIMIKSNWLHDSLAQRLGIPENKEDPYISKFMATQLNNPDTEKPCLWYGTHHLMAFHVSSKDIPQWVWATFEHVSLPGRCDITGCNDSYGYKSSDDLPKGVADNFVSPHVKSDELNSSSIVFDRDALYPPEQPRHALSRLFEASRIGGGVSSSAAEPDPEDKGWLSYRLKGSQVEFTDLRGRPTFLGNSITEAGFMDGSSCVSCHARAGIHITRDDKPNFFKLSVFENSLSDYGYARSAHGIPNENWYNDSDTPPSLDVLQTDFIWGFLFAKELVKPES